MHELDARFGRDVREVKLHRDARIAAAGRAPVQDDHERDGGQERRAKGDATLEQGSHGVNHTTRRVGETSNALSSPARRVRGETRDSASASKLAPTAPSAAEAQPALQP